jgi:hypothetical protein
LRTLRAVLSRFTDTVKGIHRTIVICVFAFVSATIAIHVPATDAIAACGALWAGCAVLSICAIFAGCTRRTGGPGVTFGALRTNGAIFAINTVSTVFTRRARHTGWAGITFGTLRTGGAIFTGRTRRTSWACRARWALRTRRANTVEGIGLAITVGIFRFFSNAVAVGIPAAQARRPSSALWTSCAVFTWSTGGALRAVFAIGAIFARRTGRALCTSIAFCARRAAWAGRTLRALRACAVESIGFAVAVGIFRLFSNAVAVGIPAAQSR